MLSLEWLNSRPYYLDSSTTPHDSLWGGVWFLFSEEDDTNYGPDVLNLAVSLSLEIDLNPVGGEGAVSGMSEACLVNRFRIDREGNVQDPSPEAGTSRLRNPFLIQEVKHPGRFIFVETPPEIRQSDAFIEDDFEIRAQWDASIDFGLSVQWSVDKEIEVGPNRYGRSKAFPGEKYYAS